MHPNQQKLRAGSTRSNVAEKKGCVKFFHNLDTKYIRPWLIYKYKSKRKGKAFDLDFEDVLLEFQALEEADDDSEGDGVDEILAKGRLGMPSVTERLSFSSALRDPQQVRKQGGLLSYYMA